MPDFPAPFIILQHRLCMAESDAIFLDDPKILDFERPLKPGYMRMQVFWNGSTNVVENTGLACIDEVVGKYRVVGSAVRYLADILEFDQKEPYAFARSELPEREPPKRRILFDGGMQIYESGHGQTGTNRYSLARTGRIWTARDDTNHGPMPLHYVIFGDKAYREEVIGLILKGYDLQEEAEKERVRKKEHEAFQSGRTAERPCR